MVIELLYIDGCPSRARTLEMIRDSLHVTGIAAELRSVLVATRLQARDLGFTGSPTVRVDGADIEVPPSASDCGLCCRVYSRHGHVSGAPPKELIVAALLRARKADGETRPPAA